MTRRSVGKISWTRFSFVAFGTAAALSLTACAAGASETATDDDSTIKITVLADITGPAAFYGEAIKDSAEFTVETINADGGLAGRTIDLVVRDTASAASTAASLMNDAILDGTDAVIFGVLTEEALTIAPLAQEAGLPVVNVQVGGDGVVETGDAIWRITPPQPNFVPTYAEYVADVVGAKTAAVFYDSDNAATVKVAAEALPAAFDEVGIELLNSVSSTSTETDLTTAVTKLLDGDPDFIHVHAIGSQNIAVITQLRRAGFEGTIGGGTAIGAGALSALDDDQANGIIYYSSFVGSAELPHETGSAFTEAFEEATGEQPNTFHAETFDAFGFIGAAVEASGDSSREGVLAGLAEVAESGGFAGAQADPITFDDRSAVTPGFVIEWRDGHETLAPGQ